MRKLSKETFSSWNFLSTLSLMQNVSYKTSSNGVYVCIYALGPTVSFLFHTAFSYPNLGLTATHPQSLPTFYFVTS